MTSSDSLQRQRKRPPRFNAINLLCVLVLIAYFLHFAVPALAGDFNEDEMTNMYFYWHLGALKSLWSNICFWKGIGRPAGALYYLPLYHFFSLDPQPYRIVHVSILVASIPIVYYLARLLSSSRSIAFLAVIALCYHVILADLVFIGSFIYDVLCGFFYFGALTYYVRVRQRESAMRPMQLFGFLALYICALNSKEMAVTLPLMVLIYEALKRPFVVGWRQFAQRNWRFAVPALIAGLLTVPYVYGKTQGSNALARVTGYTPDYSWDRFMTSNAHFASELFYLVPNHVMPPGILLVLWVAIFVYAFLRRDRTLQLMAFWIVITPLPLTFIPLRGGACLYILLFGWAMIFAKLISDLIRLLSKSSILVSQGVGGDIFRIFATIVVACAIGIFTKWENRFRHIPVLLSKGQKTSQVIQAFRSLDLHPAPGSTILLSPESRFYPNGYYPMFVASLVWNDPSLRIYVAGQSKLAEQEIAKMNYIISLNEFQTKLLRAPNSEDL